MGEGYFISRVQGFRRGAGVGAACTLVWVAWSGSWGRAGHKSRGPPEGVGEEGGGGSPHLLKFGLHFGEMNRVNLSGFIE